MDAKTNQEINETIRKLCQHIRDLIDDSVDHEELPSLVNALANLIHQ